MFSELNLKFSTKYFSALLVLCLAQSLLAETNLSPVLKAFECRKDMAKPAAEKLIDSVQSGFAEVSSMRAQFYQDSYLLSLDQSELSAGQVVLMRSKQNQSGKMRWDYHTPEEQVFIIKGTEILLYQPRMQQAVIDNLDKVLISQLPTAFLMGVGDLKKEFSVKSACQTFDSVLLKLLPVASSDDSSSLSSFDLLVDDKSFLPLGAKVTDIAGNQTAILLKSVVVGDKSVNDKEFEFELPGQIDVEDRRKEVAKDAQ